MTEKKPFPTLLVSISFGFMALTVLTWIYPLGQSAEKLPTETRRQMDECDVKYPRRDQHIEWSHCIGRSLRVSYSPAAR